MHYSVYTPPSFGIKINYPSDWKANSDESDPNAEKTTIVTFYPKINSNITDGAVKVWVDNNPRTNNLDIYLQKELDNNKKNIANYTFLSLNVDYTLSGYPAFSYNYITKVNGKDVQYLIVGSIINEKAYEVTYFAQADKFPVNLFNANSIFNSFQVLLATSGTGKGSTGTSSTSGTCCIGGSNTGSNSTPPSSINTFNPVIQFNGIDNGKNNSQSKSNNTNNTNANNTIPSQSAAASMGPSPVTNTTTNQPMIQNSSSLSKNNYPVSNAGTSKEVNEGYIVLLNGSQSYDPDGDPITFSWRQIAGPAVKLDNATSNTPSFTSPTVSTDSNLIFELTVKDNKGAKSTSIVTVTVKPHLSDPITTPFHSNMTKTKPIPNTSASVEDNGSGIVNPPLAGYLTYTNPNYDIILNYKSDWNKEEGVGSTGLQVCQGCNAIATFTAPGFENEDYWPVYVILSTYTYSGPVSLSQVVDDSLSSLKSDKTFKHVKIISSDTSSTLSGQPAYTFEYTYDWKDNKKTISTTYLETGTLVGNTVYFIGYTADTDKYSTYLPVFQNMIKSFNLTNLPK